MQTFFQWAVLKITDFHIIYAGVVVCYNIFMKSKCFLCKAICCVERIRSALVELTTVGLTILRSRVTTTACKKLHRIALH
jgi:hypothetical protein